MIKGRFPLFIGKSLKKEFKKELDSLNRSGFNLIYKEQEKESYIYWLSQDEINDYEIDEENSFLILLTKPSLLESLEENRLYRGAYLIDSYESFEVRLLEIFASIYSQVRSYIDSKEESSLKMALKRTSQVNKKKPNWSDLLIENMMANPKEFNQKAQNALSLISLSKDWRLEENILNIYGKNLFFLPVYFENNDQYLVPCDHNKLKKNRLDEALAFIYLMNEFQIDGNIKNYDWNEVDIWKDLLLETPEPLLIISEQGEILENNKSFSSLNLLPHDCLNLKDGDQIEINSKSYLIFKRSLENRKTHYMYFLENPELNKVQGNQDLGIMTSSLAHELNNPLAGILSVINILELEEAENSELVSEMKKTALRVKEMIKTFLGFSRKEIYQNTGDLFDLGKESSFSESVSQAKKLIRFKMMEENSKLDISYLQIKELSLPFNQSLMVMLLYQVFSHVVLDHSQKELVEESQSKSLLEIKEFEKSFEIELPYYLELKKEKLNRYILKTIGLNLQTRDKSLVYKFV